MCARGAQVFSWQQLFDHLEIKGIAPEGGLNRFNIAPSTSSKEATQWTRLPVVTLNEESERSVHGMIWPLIPFWCHGKLPRFSTANCRSEPTESFSETVAKKPAFRDAWGKNRRCLIPFSWFYEWDQRTKPKQPWMISAKDESIMVMAGLWDLTQTPQGNTWLSCTIMTTQPNDLLSSIGHHRAPVVLDQSDWATWLGDCPERAERLLKPPKSETMQAQPVTMRINNPLFDEDVRTFDDNPQG